MEEKISSFQPKLFQPSVWDDIPVKRDNKSMNIVIEPDFEMDLEDYHSSIKLPKGFVFVTLSNQSLKDISIITGFLNDHYIPDLVSKNLYKYNTRFIQYRLQSPVGHFKNRNTLIIGVAKSDNKNALFGLIAARPVCYSIDGQLISTYEIEWLTTHSQLRNRKIAVVLKKELYRRLYIGGYITGALFFAPMTLPFQSITEPSKLLYKRLRIVNTPQDQKQLEKLKAVKLKIKDTEKIKEINRLIEELTPIQLAPTSVIHQIRLANKTDMPELFDIYYQRCQSKFRLYRVYNQKEFEYTFTPRKDMVYTYVMMNSDGVVKDFVTIFVLNHPNDDKLKSAYLYYITFPNTSTPAENKTSYKILELFLQNVMYILSESGYDKLYTHQFLGTNNALENALGFEIVNHADKGIGCYAFNYNTKTIELKDCGLSVHI